MSTSSSAHKSAEISATSNSSIAIAKTGRSGKLLLGLFTIITAAVVVVAIVWLQERPIRQAEALLASGLKEMEEQRQQGQEPDSALLRDAYHKISDYLESHPTNSRGLALQARILVHVGRAEEAIEIFESVGPQTVEELQDFARAYMALEQYSNALPLMEQVLRQDPNYVDALYEISTCRAKLARFDEAIESATHLTKQTGNEAKGHLLLASIYAEISNRKKALESFEKVSEYEPEGQHLLIPDWQFFLLYGGTCLEDGQPEKAIPLLQKSIELEQHPDTYAKIGEAYMSAGEPQKAEQAWRITLVNAPDHPRALEQLATYELSRGNAKEALDWLQPLKKSGVANSSVAYSFQRAHALLGETEESEKWRAQAERMRKGEALVELINNVLQTAPDSAWGVALRAHRFAAMDNWEQAGTLIQTLKIDSETHPFMTELAAAVKQKRADKLPALEKLPVDLY